MKVMEEPPRRMRAYSETIVAAVGIKPPSPSPARKRSIPKMPGVGAKAHRAVKTEKLTTLIRMDLLRPITSASVPMPSAPISIPNNPYDVMAPTCGAVSPHS
jgi:hypothetical protein